MGRDWGVPTLQDTFPDQPSTSDDSSWGLLQHICRPTPPHPQMPTSCSSSQERRSLSFPLNLGGPLWTKQPTKVTSPTLSLPSGPPCLPAARLACRRVRDETEEQAVPGSPAGPELARPLSTDAGVSPAQPGQGQLHRPADPEKEAIATLS